MSYLVSIVRTDRHGSVPITLEEAIAATRKIAGWRHVEEDSSFHRQHGEDFFVLWHKDGELWAKTPDARELDSMIELAGVLDARVRGDEFETYETSERCYAHADDIDPRRDAERKSRNLLAQELRQQRLIRRGVIGFFVALGVAGFFVGRQFEGRR